MVFDGFEERLQDEGTAAEKDGVVLEKDFKCFEGDLTVQQEILMVQDEEEGGGAGAEVLQVATLDAEGAVAALVWNVESIVVDLVVLI